MLRIRLRRALSLSLAAAPLVVPLPPAAGQQPTIADVAQGLRFRSIGPAVMGGRIHDVEALPDDPATIYVAAATGGIWRSTNKGTTWTPIFDHESGASLGAIAIAPSNPRIIWVGTGEQENRQSSSWGDGVYRSTDGGDNWTHLGLDSTRQIARVVVHPTNPDIAWVAALGNLWRASPDRGVYKTTDGGRSWRKVLYVDTLTGATDLVVDPRDPNTLYAATYQRLRRAWGFNGGGSGSGIWKSSDGGGTWRPLTRGIPSGDKGRIGLAIARANPSVLYALIEHATESGTYRSSDGGESWTRVSRTDPRPMYYSAIYVDPTNENRVWVLSEGVSRSEDGGRTFHTLPTAPTYDVGLKSDHHTMWIDPHDSRHFYLGGDGGLHESWDLGQTYTRINNFPIGQFYKVAVDDRSPYWIYGGMQDNHSWMGPSATRHWNGIVNEDWREIGFGDGMYQAVDVSAGARLRLTSGGAPRFVYSESQDGDITRVDANTGDILDIKPRAPRGEKAYRFDWTAPFLVSPHAPPRPGTPATLYLGGNRLFISHDGGTSWDRTADLTRQIDRDSLRLMGVLGKNITLSKHDGESSFGEITTIAESPLDAGVLWVGTDDGNLQLSRDGGRTWANVIDGVPGLPRNSEPQVGTFVSRVLASSLGPGVAFVTFDAHRDGDFAPYVYRTTDYGRTWTRITDGLPPDGSARVVAEYPEAHLLLLGTEHALFISSDSGRRWTRWTSNLPTTRYDDIVMQPREQDVVLGTHGRSIWVLDDAHALAEWSASVAGQRAHLFSVRPATLFQYWKDFSYRAQGAYAGENPPDGALLTYWLAPGSAGGRITITDASGRLVRTLLLPASGAGILQRTNWDLRHDPPPFAPDTSADSRLALPRPAHDIGPRGPFVAPGTYTATLEADGARSTQRVVVLPDPLMPNISLADQRSREAFLLQVLALQRQVWDLARRATALRVGLLALRDSLGPSAESTVREDLRIRVDTAQALERRIATGRSAAPALRSEIYGLANDFNGSGVRAGSLHAPTRTQRDLLAQLQRELAAARAELERAEARQRSSSAPQ